MDLIYRFLGLVARLYERLGRLWFHFLPLTWILLIFFATIAVVGARGIRSVLINGDQPRVVGIAEVLEHKDTERNFVTVQGTLEPDSVFEHARDGVPVARYLLLASVADQRALLVKYDADRVPAGKEAKEAAITGMLEELDGDAWVKLSRMRFTVGSWSVDEDFLLVQGGTPGSLVGKVAITLAGIVLVLAMLLVRMWRCVVFRRTDVVDEAAVNATDGGDLRASGVFRLRDHRPRRFLDVPVALMQRESGHLAIVSQGDAPSLLFRFKKTTRSGQWSIVVSFEQMKKVDTGYLYLGLRRRPALRMTFAVKGQAKAVVVVLSCSDVGHRLFVRHELARLAEWS